MYAALTDDIRTVQDNLRHTAPVENRAAEGHPRRLSAGQHLFFESDPTTFVYQVASGMLRLTRIQKDGRRQVVAFAFPGDVVGLPNKGRYTTECDAVSSADVVARRWDRTNRPDRNPALHSFLMNAALDEIRMLQDHFLMLGRRLASEKVAAFLTLLLERIGEPIGNYHMIHLPMNRSDIADYLGLTPETISRSITQFRSQRIIALEDSQSMVVLDPERLVALSEGV